MVFDGDAPTDRQLLIGGQNGQILKIDDSAADDAGYAIASRVTIGPITPAGDLSEAKLVELVGTTGATWARRARKGPATLSGTSAPGPPPRMRF